VAGINANTTTVTFFFINIYYSSNHFEPLLKSIISILNHFFEKITYFDF